MRRLIGTTAASLLLASATMLSIAPSASADDAGIHDFMNSENASGAPTPSRRPPADQYRANYANPAYSPNPSAVTKVEKDPQVFYHAQGSMGTN